MNHAPQTPICRYNVQGTCRHGPLGRNCDYRHPKLCRKLILHGPTADLGCYLGRNCQRYHPRLCQDSMRQQVYLGENCTMPHIKRTRRYRQNPEQSWNATIRRGYQTTHNSHHKPTPSRQGRITAIDYHHFFQRESVIKHSSSNECPFLEYMKGLQTTMENLAKTVEAQGNMITSVMAKLTPPDSHNLPRAPDLLRGGRAATRSR